VNKKAAVVMVSDMLLAGVDTTATASTNILYCLAKNPEKQQKLHEEIKNILPEKNSKLTAENMKNLPYLRAVIKESMRVLPVVAGTARKTQNEVVLAGHKIPANTHVVMASYVELTNPNQYPEPEIFLPERWIRAAEGSCPHAKAANPFSYLPFGFGARMCKSKMNCIELYSLPYSFF
jgi:cytochrome P450 family 12